MLRVPDRDRPEADVGVRASGDEPTPGEQPPRGPIVECHERGRLVGTGRRPRALDER
jgi:hypothetical protein